MNAVSARRINALPKPAFRPVIGPGPTTLSIFQPPDASRLKTYTAPLPESARKFPTMIREPEAATAFPNVALFAVSLEGGVSAVSGAQVPAVLRKTNTAPLLRVKTIGPTPRMPVDT